MDGIFNRKMRLILPIIFICGGLFFVGIALAACFSDETVDAGWIFILIFGLAYIILAITILLFNRGAFLHMDENSIQAKYHWGRRLDCSINDIAFVLPQLNALRIRLKNGKLHMIMGLQNPWELCAAIRRQIFVLETETPDALRQKLAHIQAARKKELRWVIVTCIMMFANIFIAVLLTGARDMADFTDLDWTCFTIMCIIEALTILAFFYTASRSGKYVVPMEETKHRLLGAVIASHPLSSNRVVGIYTDENYSGRIVVCGYPNDESVYYYAEQFTQDFTLQTVYTSADYNNAKELPDDGFSVLIDITSSFNL